MEELAIYDCKFVYVKGEDNTVADSLSQYPFPVVTNASEAEATGHHPGQIGTGCIAHVAVLGRDRTMDSTPLCAVTVLASATQAQESKQVVVDETLVNEIREAYGKDPWCKQLLSATRGMPELHIKDGL